MLWIASLLLRAVYLLLPAASIGVGVRGRYALRRFIVSGWLGGAVLATGLLTVYAIVMNGRPSVWQAVLAVYLGVGLMLFLKTVDLLLLIGIRRAVLNADPGKLRLFAVAICRVILFGSFALPWVMAAVMVYRPKVQPEEPIPGMMDVADSVTFPAADGTTIHGWYIEAEERSAVTALLCHGLGGNTGGFVKLIDRLHHEGVNVLAIDLRAHGGSGGQFCTFGLRERDDVTGAVLWLRQNHSVRAERIVGVGASLGAAAILSAAVDEPHLDGVVVLSTYSSMAEEVDDLSRRQFVPPLGWLVRNLGLPMASVHVGVDLRRSRPAADVAQLWPRPVLVVHGMEDEVIPFAHGRRIYDAAPINRTNWWVRVGTHNGILDDDHAIDRVVKFIQSARPVPLV